MMDFPILVLAGAFAGGLVSGLTGFGTGLVVLPSGARSSSASTSASSRWPCWRNRSRGS